MATSKRISIESRDIKTADQVTESKCVVEVEGWSPQTDQPLG